MREVLSKLDLKQKVQLSTRIFFDKKIQIFRFFSIRDNQFKINHASTKLPNYYSGIHYLFISFEYKGSYKNSLAH